MARAQDGRVYQVCTGWSVGGADRPRADAVMRRWRAVVAPGAPAQTMSSLSMTNLPRVPLGGQQGAWLGRPIEEEVGLERNALCVHGNIENPFELEVVPMQ